MLQPMTLEQAPVLTPIPGTLYVWPTSAFCNKVRMAARYKGLAFRAVQTASMSDLSRFRAATGVGKVPHLKLDDGTWIGDSTTIAGWLETQFPTPSLHPSDPVERASCALLEDWADEALRATAEPLLFLDPRVRPLMFEGMFDGPLAGTVLLPLVGAISRSRFQKRANLHGGEGPCRALFNQQLDALDARVAARPFLFGDQPTIADFAIAAQLNNHVRFGVEGVADRALHGWLARTLTWLDRDP